MKDEKTIKLYHLIYGHKLLCSDGVIKPYIPQNTVINEDKSVKRICVAGSIDECLTGIGPSIIGIKSCLDLIHKNEKDTNKMKFPFIITEFEMDIDDECLLSPDEIIKYVPDAKMTGEYWITKEMKASCVKVVWMIDGDIIEEPFKYNGKTYIFGKVRNAKFSDKEALPSVKLREGVMKQARAWVKNNLVEEKNKPLDQMIKECSNKDKANNKNNAKEKRTVFDKIIID